MGPVRGIDFHSNQPIFVSGGDDFKIKVWNYKQKKCLFDLLGHLDYIRTTFFHKEYPWILSASDDQTIRIWNWQSRTLLSILSGHSHYVMCAQFHPKEDLIVSGSLDQTVRVWDISGLRKKNVAPSSHSGIEDHMRLLSDTSRYGGTGHSATGHTELFGTGDVIVRHVLEGHDRGVNWVAFHPTSNVVISAADDRLIKLWRLSETKAWELDTLRGHFNNVSSVLFHPRQDLIISDSEDKSIRIWDAVKRTCLTTIRRDSDRFWVITAHPRFNLFAAGHDTGFVVFKLDRERPAFAVHKDYLFYVKAPFLRRLDFVATKDIPLIQLRENRGPAASLAFNAIENAALVLSRSRDADLDSNGTSAAGTNKMIYDLYLLPKDVGDVAEVQTTDSRSGSGIAVAWVGRNKFAVLESPGSIILKNLQNEKLKRLSVSGVDNCFFAGTGHLLLRDPNGVSLYDLGNGRALADVKSTKSIRHVVWSPDGQYMAIFTKLNLYLCDRQLEIKATVQETVDIKSGAWEERGIFIYTTSNHIKYVLPNGDSGIIRTLELPVYITRVRGSSVFCLNREYAPVVLSIDSTEYDFKFALINRRYDEVLHMVRNANLVGQAIIGYLERKGFPEVALHFVKDTRTRFSLAMDCGQLQIGLDAAQTLDDKACWERLGELALRQGNYQIVEMAYQRTKDFDKLSFLYLLTGNTEKLKKMLKIAEIRKDLSSQYQIALSLGNIFDSVKALRDGGQKPLAYLSATTHGLCNEQTELTETMCVEGSPVKDFVPPWADSNTSLFLPSPPIWTSGGDAVQSEDFDQNWPHLSVQLDYFEAAIAWKKVADPSADKTLTSLAESARLTLECPTTLETEWGEDAELELSVADEFQDAVAGDLTDREQRVPGSTESGWDIDDAELELPADSKTDQAVEETGDKRFTAPSYGLSPSSVWTNNARSVADHASAGNWPEAMKMLNSQIGVVKFEPLRHNFMLAFCSSRSLACGVPSTPSVFLYPQRNWKKPSTPLPTYTLSLNMLIDRLQLAYQLTTQGKFNQAVEQFRSILWSIPLLVVDCSAEESEALRLMSVCKEYIVGLLMEQERKSMPKETVANQVRSVEMACYFTHCRLEKPHLILTLRTALNLLFKLKNFRTAAMMAQRLLDLAPSVEVATQTRKILQACQSANPQEDAHKLDYDPRNPFEICAGTFTPIYRGKPHVKDPMTGACYTSKMEGQVCRVTKITEIGAQSQGLRLFAGKNMR